MEKVPEIVKAQRDFSDYITVEFRGENGAENFKRSFSLIRGGLAWPIRALPGYLCAVGQLHGSIPDQEGSMMLVYESRFASSTDLLLAAANLAKDLRFGEYFTDLHHPEWDAFHHSFHKHIRSRLDMADIRIKHTPFAEDFIYGVDVIRRWAKSKYIALPAQSLLLQQLRSIVPEDLQRERPEYKFDAINGFRFVAVSFDKIQRPRSAMIDGPTSMEGWT